MNSLESWILTYLLNSLWQIPLIVLAAWVAGRVVRAAGTRAQHRVWVAALLGEAILPAVSTLPWERLHLAWPWQLRAAKALEGNVVVQMGTGVGSEGFKLPAALITSLTVGYAAVTLYFGARFVWGWWRLRELSHAAGVVELRGQSAISWSRWLAHFGAERVAMVSSGEIFAPLTIGIAKKCVMLPAAMVGHLPQAELDAVIGHELAHVRRQDFLKNLLYEFLTLPVGYHPGVWFTRQRMTETREMVCDEMAAEIAGGREYAQSLLRLAGLLLQGRQVGVPYAIGVFDSSTLERRLMKLTEKRQEIGRARRIVALGACVVLGIAAATSAVALRIGVDQKSSSDNAALSKKIPASVPPDKMAQTLITKVNPVYPPEAKKARIQGKVVLEAVIGKTGHVENLKVVSGPNELQQSAMDAVRQWVYKPYLLNGNPIEVTTKITVIYTLAK